MCPARSTNHRDAPHPLKTRRRRQDISPVNDTMQNEPCDFVYHFLYPNQNRLREHETGTSERKCSQCVFYFQNCCLFPISVSQESMSLPPSITERACQQREGCMQQKGEGVVGISMELVRRTSSWSRRPRAISRSTASQRPRSGTAGCPCSRAWARGSSDAESDGVSGQAAR